MTAPARTVTLLIVLAFIAYLLWSTLASQRVECTISVEFKNDHRTATASGASEEAAAREAQTTACGPLAGSMDERLACASRTPVSRSCRPI
jgi:hypothetical protein